MDETRTAIPTEINLAKTKPPATPAYARKFQSLAPLASYTPESQALQIFIDTSTPGSFFDPQCTYLQFDIRVDATVTATTQERTQVFLSSAGINSIFEDMRIFVQGVPIEEIREYHTLCSFLHDLHGVTTAAACGLEFPVTCQSADNDNNPLSIVHRVDATMNGNYRYPDANYVYHPRISGPSNGQLTRTAMMVPEYASHADRTRLLDIAGNVLYGAPVNNANGIEVSLTDNSKGFTEAEQSKGDRATNRLKTGITYRCQVPLVSGILGTMAEKMFPAMLLAPGTLMLEMRLATANKAFFFAREQTGATGLTYTLSNVKFVGKQIILQDSVASAIIDRAASGDISIHTQSYRSNNVQFSGIGDQNLLISAKIASANSIYFVFRDSMVLNSAQYNSFGRTSIGFDNSNTCQARAQLRVGNDFLPPQPIDSSNECYRELLKAHHLHADISVVHDPLMGQVYFGDSGNTVFVTDYDYNAITYDSPMRVYKTNYTNDSGVAAGGRFSTFALGFDLDTFTYANDSMRSGKFIGNNSVYLLLQGIYPVAADASRIGNRTIASARENGYSAADSTQVTYFILHDMRLSFQAGGIVQAFY